MNNRTFDREIDRLKEEYFSKMFIPLTSMYVDLEAIQNMHIGALALHLKSTAEYEYFKKQCQQYGSKLVESTMEYFPDIKLTDDDLDKIISDESFHDMLALVSPMNLAYLLMLEFLAQMYTNNLRGDSKNRIKLTIGTSSVKYTDKRKKALKSVIESLNSMVDVSILDMPIYNMPLDQILKFDVFMLTDIEKFINHPTVADAFGTKFSFELKKLYAFPILRNELPDNVSVEQSLMDTHAALNICCEFGYIERGLTIQQHHEG